MSAAERLASELLALPVSDRAKLVHLLLESLEDATDVDVEAAWAAELGKRANDLQSGAVDAIPWDDARDNIISELQVRRANRSTP